VSVAVIGAPVIAATSELIPWPVCPVITMRNRGSVTLIRA
jgi:hypothetical protein